MTKWILTVEVEDWGYDHVLDYVSEALDQIPEGSAYVLNTEESDEGVQD